MKLGLVGYQGSGKSALFELFTGGKPDPAKAHLGQLGDRRCSNARFRRAGRPLQAEKGVARPD